MVVYLRAMSMFMYYYGENTVHNFFLFQMKTRSKESLTRLGDVLQKMKPSEFKDNHLAAYKVLKRSFV